MAASNPSVRNKTGFNPASLNKGATWSLKQNDSQERLVGRLNGRVHTPEGRKILEWIDICTQMQPNGRRLRCNQPMCPTCGVLAKERLGRQKADKIRVLQAEYGQDHVSAITINAEPCSLRQVENSYKELRKAISKSVRSSQLGHLTGEFEVIKKDMITAESYFDELERFIDEREEEFDPKRVIRVVSRLWNPTCTLPISERLQGLRSKHFAQIENKVVRWCGNKIDPDLLRYFDAEMEDFFNPQPKTQSWLYEALTQKVGTRLITTEGRLMVHLHGFLIHPKHTREQVANTFEQGFTGVRAVKVEPIEDKHRHGRVVDGAETYANYFTDKSGAVKGNLRINCDPREQALIFDAYAAMSKGTRRRPGIRIGKLTRPLSNQVDSGDSIAHGLNRPLAGKLVFDPLDRGQSHPAPPGDGPKAKPAACQSFDHGIGLLLWELRPTEDLPLKSGTVKARPNSLLDDRPFKFCENSQHGEERATRRARSIDPLGEQEQIHSPRLKIA